MIQQRPGDVLEIEFEGKFYYLVVITKIFMFGGNIVYAFHGTGERIESFSSSPLMSGFNICTDLLLPKKEGIVRRIATVENPTEYIARMKNLSEEYSKAMDSGAHSFDLTANKILTDYTPDKNPFLKSKST